MPKIFENASVETKANIYFDGKVISHSLLLSNGDKKTLGLIYPGKFLFNTDSPEHMEITSGNCRVKIAHEENWKTYHASEGFHVPGKSSFEIEVDSGVTEYICSFLK